MSSAPSNERKVQLVVADPSALGLFGLAMVTLVAASAKLGWTNGNLLLIPWAVLLGGVAQLIACIYDFKHNNLFGATAFGAYGLFWISVAGCWGAKIALAGTPYAAAMDGRQLGFAFVGYLVFSLFMTLAAMETNRVLFWIMVLINVLLSTLAIDSLGGGVHWAHETAAWTELAISALGFYASAGAMLNKFFGRAFVPMGRPFGIFKPLPGAAPAPSAPALAHAAAARA